MSRGPERRTRLRVRVGTERSQFFRQPVGASAFFVGASAFFLGAGTESLSIRLQQDAESCSLLAIAKTSRNPGMVQRRVTLRAYEPEAQARVGVALACASGSYDRQDESEKCYPERRAIEPRLHSEMENAVSLRQHAG